MPCSTIGRRSRARTSRTAGSFSIRSTSTSTRCRNFPVARRRLEAGVERLQRGHGRLPRRGRRKTQALRLPHYGFRQSAAVPSGATPSIGFGARGVGAGAVRVLRAAAPQARMRHGGNGRRHGEGGERRSARRSAANRGGRTWLLRVRAVVGARAARSLPHAGARAGAGDRALSRHRRGSSPRWLRCLVRPGRRIAGHGDRSAARRAQHGRARIGAWPPINPVALEARQFEPFRRMLQASMHYAGAIRLDHVLGLKRLFLVPRRRPPNAAPTSAARSRRCWR